MDKKTFDKVIGNLMFVTKNCQDIAGAYERDQISEKYLEKARMVQAGMDKIFMSEVYHIIGMGDLDIIQNSLFSEAIKNLSKYRQVVKFVASGITNCEGKLKGSESKYKSLLAQTVLKGEDENGCRETKRAS